MDSKVTVFLIVMLLAVLRGLMQRSQVRKEIEERKARQQLQSKGLRINKRQGPIVERSESSESERFDNED